MIINNTNGSTIELVDGGFMQRLRNGTKINLFLYKYRRVESYLTLDDVFNTTFEYDIVVLDDKSNCYLYFTYNFLDDPEEVF